MVNTEV